MGWSLAQLALTLQWHDEARQITLRSLKPICLQTAFAYAAGALRIDVESCVAAYCFSWIENQVAAALKAVPLGQTAGQKILFAMHTLIPEVVLRAKPARPAKEIIAAETIGVAIIAARTSAGLSQTELASRTKTAQPLGRLEKGGSLPSVRTLQRIAKATGHKLVISFTPIT
jgi:urease accessory protein UreF